MLGALLPHVGNGWMFTGTGGGWEYPAFLVLALIAQVLLGDGAMAVSRVANAQRGAVDDSPGSLTRPRAHAAR